MMKKMLKIIYCGMFVSLLASLLLTVSVFSQGEKPKTKPQLEAEIKEAESKLVILKKEISDLDKKIEAVCKNLSTTINLAESDLSEFPYYSNVLNYSRDNQEVNFLAKCKVGTLTWLSELRTLKGPIPEAKDIEKIDKFTVSLDVKDLMSDRISQEHGRIVFYADSPKINVKCYGEQIGITTGSNNNGNASGVPTTPPISIKTAYSECREYSPQLFWWLDLHASKYADPFIGELKTLINTLADKKKKEDEKQKHEETIVKNQKEISNRFPNKR